MALLPTPAGLSLVDQEQVDSPLREEEREILHQHHRHKEILAVLDSLITIPLVLAAVELEVLEILAVLVD